MSKKSPTEKEQKIFESCPHCGKELSPWEQVLLSVDRALTCKHCWYRILIDIARTDEKSSDKDQSAKKEK